MIRVLLAAMLVCLAPLAASADTPEVLKVSAMKVQFVPVVDYAATVEGLAAKKLDLVWYGGFTSVQAVKRTQGQATRLAMRKEDAEFKSVFVARKDGPIKSLADLKGKTFAFGSVSSTSGHLMPRYFLLKNGLNPERHFGQKPAFSGGSGAGSVRAAAPAVDAAPGAADSGQPRPSRRGGLACFSRFRKVISESISSGGISSTGRFRATSTVPL
jgi:phosphate/phosphite/phosphonate ABC transporter binding protein